MTSVEWFAQQLLSYKSQTNINGTDYILIPINKVEFLETKAKQMEKEQAFKFFKAGQDSMEEGGKSFDQLDQFGDANKMVKLCPYFCYVVCECDGKCTAKGPE